LNYLYAWSFGLNITVLSLSLELLCFILCSVGADFLIRPWQNCFLLPFKFDEKTWFRLQFSLLLISCFFPLLCLSCMSH